MAKKKDMFTINVDPSTIMYTNISKSKNGYNSARMVVKSGENEYMSISYEWEGDGIPGFAMDLMSYMKKAGVEKSGVWPDQEEAFKAFSKKYKKKKMKDDEEEDEDE